VGTYFPVEAFMQVLQQAHEVFVNQREKTETEASKISEEIIKGPIIDDKFSKLPHFPPPMAILDALKEFQDNENGGYGEAPKFPNFSFYEWAIEQMIEGKVDQNFGNHIIFSLEKFLMGGVFDQLRGGVFRYSVDEKLLVPHFEKMLYDQSGLLRVLAKLSLIFPSPVVWEGLIKTLNYLEHEMIAKEGLFFSSQDSDSEGVEGLFYTFDLEEFKAIIRKASNELAADLDNLIKWFGLEEKGNFENKQNVISLNHKYAKEIFSEKGWKLITLACEALLKERKKRIPPKTDSKGIASWNWMMLTAICDVIHYCPQSLIKSQAMKILHKVINGTISTFILNEKNASLPTEGNIILHSTTQKTSPQYLEDYVFFAECMLRLYEVSGNQNFKDNFFDTLKFIHKEFIHENKIYTRPTRMDKTLPYPNLAVHSFDSSYRSPLATLVGITRRGALLSQDKKLLEPIEGIEEKLLNESLNAPFSSGEGLRALSYPKDVYKVLKVPESWLNKAEFSQFISYFMPRFVLDYQTEDSQKWQICSLKNCELQGEGLKNFIETLTPKESTKKN
jgi:uncharacterized protein YyaL (SSP411 family)